MSAFNVLTVEIPCSNCEQKNHVRVQFKFGDTWQLEYKLGDIITWGGNDIGSSDLGKVKVYGIAESTTCVFCHKNDIPEEYDIFITDSLIKSISPVENLRDYLERNGEYVSLE
jgi:hypothetical protein